MKVFRIQGKYPEAFPHRKVLAQLLSLPPVQMHSCHLLCIHPKGEHFSPSHPYPYRREPLVPYGTFPGMPHMKNQWEKISVGFQS